MSGRRSRGGVFIREMKAQYREELEDCADREI
jgi:hypothetical protein